MKKRLANALRLTSLLLLLSLAVAAAMEISGTMTLWWDVPEFEESTKMIESVEEITISFTGETQIRTLAGEVLTTQSIQTDCQPSDTLEQGQCGTVTTWTWDTDAFPREQLEEWTRACWVTSVYTEPSCVIFVPPGCDLSGAGCTVNLEADGHITVPTSCMTALRNCGTRQDEAGFWLTDSFTGTQWIKYYFPIIFKEAAD